MYIDFKGIKEKLTDNDIKRIIHELGGECRQENDTYMLFDSILYHKYDADKHKPKMYWYKESRVFFDYKCGKGFDVVDGVKEYTIKNGLNTLIMYLYT